MSFAETERCPGNRAALDEQGKHQQETERDAEKRNQPHQRAAERTRCVGIDSAHDEHRRPSRRPAVCRCSPTPPGRAAASAPIRPTTLPIKIVDLHRVRKRGCTDPKNPAWALYFWSGN